MESKVIHFLHCPFTGLGLYGGFRGDRWLRNRIKIFKQFVIPSIQVQTRKDFVLWIAWRHEEKNNQKVIDLKNYLDSLSIPNVFTYSGICFYDDKYTEEVALERLVSSIHSSTANLLDTIGEANTVLMTIQPSDDCYHSTMVQEMRDFFDNNPDKDLFGYAKGYVMDYVGQRLSEWNPKTTPPFYTIKFTRDNFVDPLKHMKFTGPYKSHEYPKDYMKAVYVDTRGFLVGTHGCNISTVFDHPYVGHEFLGDNIQYVLSDFGLRNVPKLDIPFSLLNLVFLKMPYGMKRKLRFWGSEKKWILRPFFGFIYNILRS